MDVKNVFDVSKLVNVAMALTLAVLTCEVLRQTVIVKFTTKFYVHFVKRVWNFGGISAIQLGICFLMFGSVLRTATKKKQVSSSEYLTY